MNGRGRCGAARRALVLALVLAGGMGCGGDARAVAQPVPADVPRVAVGDPYIDFTAPDADGNAFTLSSLDGTPILLKFFRGHW